MFLITTITFLLLFGHHNVASLQNNIEYDVSNEIHGYNETFTELKGGSIVGERILRHRDSPFFLRSELEVKRGAKLIIEPGVTIHFAPMIGLSIEGTIKAVGTPENKIKFMPQADSILAEYINEDPKQLGIRLVDGPTPLEGRLQIFYKGSWRSTCTNSRNWTTYDYEIACRQMGFNGGRFWNWMDKEYNFQSRMLYEEPNCKGTESSLTECSWSSIQLGSGVCDYHRDIGIQCLPVHERPLAHWKGLHFQNAPVNKHLAMDNTVYSLISESELKYVEIVRAGSGRNRLATSAVNVIGMPPQMDYVSVDHSAYTGINITQPDAGFTLRHITVRRSKGIGIFVNSSYGLAHFEDCSISENGDDGIKYVGHDLRSNERNDRYNIHEFCTLPTTAGQTYPISVSVVQTFYSAAEKECGKYFITRSGYVLTVHFDYFTIKTNETAQIDIFDGSSPNDRLLASWMIRNSTRHQSVTSLREKVFVRFRANSRSEVFGYLRLTTGLFKSFDLNVTNSVVEDNAGRGIAADNIRSQLHVHHSSISNNGHVAGVHITSGAADVNVTMSKISFNQGDGINITYYGGNKNISRSSLSSNKGYGLAIWLNETVDIYRKEFIQLNQTTTVEYSEIFNNLETGIRHGNFCADHWVNITGNHFNDSMSNDIDIQTCWLDINPGEKLHLQIGHNRIEHSQQNGILISPALVIRGKIEYNQFRYGKHGALFIQNPQWEEFNMKAAHFVIQHNNFEKNMGLYVVSLGLSTYTDREDQWILFTRNFVRDNSIKEPFGPIVEGSEGEQGAGRLNPRSRIAAPVVVSSKNVDIFRNIMSNPQSKYEIGSQLCDQSQIINATYNWLGHSDEEKLFNRLFHRKDRYNLAKIEYIPYLLHNSNPGTSTIIAHPTFVPKFFTEGLTYIGGEVDGQEIIPAGMYTVNRDINIRPGGKLVLQHGVVLNFEPSVGMMVAGKLEARGRQPDDIMFTLRRQTVFTAENDTTENIVDAEMIDSQTEVVLDIPPREPEVPVRLIGGMGKHEGRLQLYIDGQWGTVCDYGWTITNAALVCHHLGYTLNPSDWRLERSEIPNVGIAEDVTLSNVRCSPHDIDITKCRAERLSRNEFSNSCSHENDVGVRCYEGAWAGLRFSVLAERADLQYLTVEKAGLFDYSTNAFRPAIQMDLARHNMENVRVVNNLNDGLGIIYSDVFGGNSVNNLKNSEFVANRGNGISLKQLGLRVQGSVIRDNLGSGILHDPVVSAIDQKEISGWFRMSSDFNTIDSNYDPYILPSDYHNIDLDSWQSKHVITEKHYGESMERKIIIKCPPGYVIGIQLLNPIENRSTEEVIFYDSQTENSRADVWKVKRDLSVFPITSSSYGVIMVYKSGTKALGGTVFMFSTISAPVQNIRNRIVRAAPPTLLVKSTKIQRNLRGVSANYYNRYMGERGEHYLRKANESIKIIRSEISYNQREAVYINAPFWDVHVSNISEITLHLNSTTIMKNGGGIKHQSKDLRSSNNIFHYVLQDTVVEDNNAGGFDISLPYVWQYNENYTHSVYIANATWRQNTNFKFAIQGHFAAVNISTNLFADNNCPGSLIAMEGMEKKIKIDNNIMKNNNARSILEFRSDSLSEIMGEVPAIVTLNEIRNNQLNHSANLRLSHIRIFQTNSVKPTSTIKFDGVQKVDIYRNLIYGNSLDYDLVAGIRSARLNNVLFASENWWGSTDVAYIQARIFDFDDWNNHAEVKFRPYLIEDTFDASVSLGENDISHTEQDFDINRLGGRIFKDLIIPSRLEPYLITSDITVMPGITLTISHGVQMEFAPNVGILVLGTLRAVGFKESPIELRVAKDPLENLNRIEKRSLEYMNSMESIRLCVNRNCSLNPHENGYEGFLEYFNRTTLQWVPVCDRRFTERNAQTVCRELGYDPLDVYFGHDRRIDFHTNSLTRIWSWLQPLECRGDEGKFEDCPERLNGQLYGRRHECHWDDQFVFVHCTGNPQEKKYWGGIRFANADFEVNFYDHGGSHDLYSHGVGRRKDSHLEFVNIQNAGILHNEKSPALQIIQKSPTVTSITIENTAHHAINLISPTESINLKFIKINNVLGNGINAVSLTGEGRESDESSFTPLKSLDLPYNMFSLIDICDTTKVVTVEERVLLYYKYDSNPVNCVKIFNAAYRVKPLGFRLLQSNLFNHSKEYGRTDSIRLYDGDIYNVSSVHIGTVESDTENSNKFFKSIGPVLSVRLIASGAPASHGFIAEIVTVPISTIGFNRDSQHNISYSEITGAVKGAISYSTSGEVSPVLTMSSNRFERNCRQMYGNFSTCESAIDIDAQNMQSLFFMNNLVKKNQGGLSIRADSRGSATSLRAWIHNNLFVENLNRPALQMEGRQSSPYQLAIIFKNYITQNDAKFCNVISLRQVVSNFTYNYIHSNIGGRIMEISGFDKVRLPIYQSTSHNGFYKNYANDWRGRATVVAGTAGQHYFDNIFYNPDNDYEMITVNRSTSDFQHWNSTLEIWKTKIDARHNYWSYNETLSVGSRIRDKSDDVQLLEVQYSPFYMNNETILDGKCPPSWSLIDNTCYIYVGSPMTFHEAREFCLSDNATMPFIRTDSNTLWTFLQSQMQPMRYPEKVWIQDFNYIDRCTAFIYRNVEIEECSRKLGFVCEIDPKVQIDPLSWRADIFAISIITAFFMAIILLVLVGFCWYAKSKHRHVQRLQRRNSIRQSLRSLNSIDPQGSMRRRNFHVSDSTNTLTKSTATDYKKMTSNGSIDSMDKSVLSSEASFETYEEKSHNLNDYIKQLAGTSHAAKGDHNGNTNLNKLKLPEQKTATVGNRNGKTKIYGLPNFNPPSNYELSYRNEGFRDNSTFSGTHNNSTTTDLTEDTPIIHQTDADDTGSDYFCNASTLPLRSNAENLSFLKELKKRLPDYDQVQTKSHSSFLPPPPDPPIHLDQSNGSSSFAEKIDRLNFTPVDELARSRPPAVAPIDLRRPDSYYTAVRSSRAPAQLPALTEQKVETSTSPQQHRPKTVYLAAEDNNRPPSYTRSKSEALLETNFDGEEPGNYPLTADSRSLSQPLETDM